MSPPTNTTIPWQAWQSAMQSWAEGASGLPVIWARQAENPPQVRKPYVLLDIISVARRGQSDGVTMVDDGAGGVDAATYGIREIILNVQVIANARGTLADSAFAWAEEMQNSIDIGPDLQKFVTVGLGVSEVTKTRDIGSMEQSQFVSRVTFDIIFEGAVARTGSWKASAVARVIGDGDVDGNSTPELTFDVES